MNVKRAAGYPRRTLYTVSGHVGSEAELVNAGLGADSLIAGAGVSLTGCNLRRTKIQHAEGLVARRCQLEMVDAAGAGMERCSLRDSTVVESRFTGARLNEADLDNVVFSGCKMNLLQCQLSKLRRVRFDACDLSDAYFNGGDLTGATFEGSDLTGADFSGAVLRGCDLRRATIEDIRVAPDQLTGVIVTSDQALYLARLFGLDVRE